jgi:hypothetical protein
MIEVGYRLVIMPTLTVFPAIQAMWSSVRGAAEDLGLAAGRPRDTIENLADVLEVFRVRDFIAKQEAYGPAPS